MTPLPTQRFGLERHAGPYESWPPRTRLYADGRATDTRVRGYTLLHQFQLDDGYLLVTDYDCPFEEITVFTLLDRGLRVRSVKFVGTMYSSYVLSALRWIDRTRFIASFGDDYHLRITIRPWGILYLFPRLAERRVHHVPPATEPGAAPADGP